MIFFGKKEMKVIGLFLDYLDCIENSLRLLEKFFRSIVETEEEQIQNLQKEIFENETLADKKRRSLEKSMYRGSFMPGFRGDVLGLTEGFDKIANEAEKIADQYCLEGLKIPKTLNEKIINQFQASFDTFKFSKKAAISLMNDATLVEEYITNTSELENKEDLLERGIIKEIFEMDFSLSEKRQLKDFISSIGTIADIAENCADRIQISLFKRL